MELQNAGLHVTIIDLNVDQYLMTLINSFKLKSLHRYSKRVFIILLLFSFFTIYGQQISINNKNTYALHIKYKNNSVKLNGGESKTIKDKEIGYLNIEYDNGKNLNRKIPLFLKSDESLKVALGNHDQLIKFKGDKDSLHSLVINQQHYILYKNVVKYLDIYKKRDTNELKNFSELVLADYFDKINKSMNASILDNKNETYKKIEKYVINDWVSSVYLSLARNLDLQSKELVLFYYNKYIKKDIENYQCEYNINYNIISALAKWNNQIKIALPKYPIIENTEDDSINQYLTKSCQRFYFRTNLNYLEKINSPKKDYYQKVLTEKFDKL